MNRIRMRRHSLDDRAVRQHLSTTPEPDKTSYSVIKSARVVSANPNVPSSTEVMGSVEERC